MLIIVPSGTTVTALVATFTTTGISVKVGNTIQVSGTTANDFTTSVTYVVIAEDGTTQDYKVIVTFPAVENSGFSNTWIPGDSGIQTLGKSSETITMIYENNLNSIIFPTGTYDSGTGTATLTTKFFMGETEVTNAVMAEIYQWAYDNNWFSTTTGDHNELSSRTVKHGGQELLNLDDTDCRVGYINGSFTAESG